ncbi:LD-carboxypeptidase [Thermoplasmatales archaeon AK]|nr:LD-carboxypeptidase [Thermoplasmatales archaeon AK]
MEHFYREATDIIAPPALKQGSNIRIIAPASAPDLKNLSISINRLSKIGYRVSLGENIRKLVQRNSLAAPAEYRARELNEAFLDESVDAIFCARGGYGSIHILQLIDYDSIRNHPKIFVGYSDITALHLAINKITGLTTFHGPMPASDPDEFSKATFKIFLDILSGKDNDINPFINRVVRYIHKGKTRGISMGTNISVASSLIGTPFFPSAADKILFAEDTGITSGDLDRYFSVMKLTGMLDRFSGFAFGEFKQITTAEEPMPYIEDIVQLYLEELKKTSVYGLPFGHGEDQMMIPLNSKMTLSTDPPYLELLTDIVN